MTSSIETGDIRSFEQRMQSLEQSSLRQRISSNEQEQVFNSRNFNLDDNEDDDDQSTSDNQQFSIYNLVSPKFYLTLIWNSIHSATFASVFVILLIWASIFIYITFYFLYIPSLDFSKNIYFEFHSDCLYNYHQVNQQSEGHKGYQPTNGCKSPEGVVQLSNYKQPTVFAKGQPYHVKIQLNLPESTVNSNQGMFMVKLSLNDLNQKTIVSSSRPSMVTYKSFPVKLIETFFSWPLILVGVKRESETLDIPLIEDYVDGVKSNSIASTAVIRLIARDLQVYSASLIIQAHLTGLRHYMVHFPILTAVFGVSIIFCFLSLITICSINRVVRENDDSTEILFPEADDHLNEEDNEVNDSNSQSGLQAEGQEVDQDPDSTVDDDLLQEE